MELNERMARLEEGQEYIKESIDSLHTKQDNRDALCMKREGRIARIEAKCGMLGVISGIAGGLLAFLGKMHLWN